MTIRRKPVEETINDVNSTKFAVLLIAIAITLGLIQALLQNFLSQDLFEWIVNRFGITVLSIERIVTNAIANNIVFPILVIVLTFYIGNIIKGEAESFNHVVRAIGYSVSPLIISTSFSFLSLIPNIIIEGLVGFVNFALGIWFVIIIIFALMTTFKKGALTGIGALALSAIIAGIVSTLWTFFIP
ncbi:MAG: YIP1 family protein [Promethearchaeota archaeon]